MSFDTDTGLKQAIALVNDYNPLMKDFPINDLLSATELEKIRYFSFDTSTKPASINGSG